MSDPFSWALIATQTASAVVGTAQAMQQATADQQAAEANAAIMRENAAQARREAASEEEAKRYELRQSWGRSAAALSQAGTGGPGYGSPGMALTQSAARGELDALNIRYGGETEANASLTQAAQFDAEARAAKRRRKGALISGILGTGAAALGGYSDYRTRRAMRSVLATQGGVLNRSPSRRLPPKPTASAPAPKLYGGR